MEPDADENRLAHLADPGPGPLPSAETLQGIVARYRRRRTRALGAALVVALLGGPVVGFTVGRAGDHGSGQTVAAAGAGTRSGPRAPVARTDTAEVRAVPSGVAGSAAGPDGQPPPRPKRVFLRDTADGVRVRVYLPSFPVGGEPGMPKECFPKQFLETQVSDDAMAASVQASMYASAPDPDPITVLGVDQVGYMEGSPVSVVSLRAATNVARVKTTFAGGVDDEMSPVGGWAVLAGHMPPTAQTPPTGTVVAFDAGGRVLATVSLSPVQQPKLPDSCMPMLPPPPSKVSVPAVPASPPTSRP